MTTLKDVGRLAGVDASTASRVLRGDPGRYASSETRKRIEKAAKALRYRPNAWARGLRTRRTDAIGFIIPNLDNVGLSDVTHGIQFEAAASSRLVLVVEADTLSGDGGGLREVYTRLLEEGVVDGLIAAFATLDDHFVSGLVERGIPLVLVNRRTSGVHGSVVVDDHRGIELAVNHLVELGHRSIGYVGLAAQTDTAQRRALGFRDAIDAAAIRRGMAPITAAAPTIAGGRAGFEDLFRSPLSERPTAVICSSLLGAVGFLAEAKAAHIAVPDQLSVIAFNDHELAGYLDPPLTTVRMPNFRMGQEAVRMLVAAIEGESVGDVMIDESPAVVVRESTRPPQLSRSSKPSRGSTP
jgi:LacI family transcriptional regulator